VYGNQSADWYEGNFVEGRREGKGRFVFSDGSVYDGEWKQGLYSGQGELKSNGKTYTGDFKLGLAHGWGKEVAPDGSVIYEGKWIKGDPEAVAKRKEEMAKRELAAHTTLLQPRRDRETTTTQGASPPSEPDCEAVVDVEVTDAEGNVGSYTGLVLRYTRKPHGVGRMVYSQGNRIHEGFWKVRTNYLAASKLTVLLVVAFLTILVHIDLNHRMEKKRDTDVACFSHRETFTRENTETIFGTDRDDTSGMMDGILKVTTCMTCVMVPEFLPTRMVKNMTVISRTAKSLVLDVLSSPGGSTKVTGKLGATTGVVVCLCAVRHWTACSVMGRL